MTLAQQFAQVREALDRYVNHERSASFHVALSSIERHVQDMEKALAQIASDIHPARPVDEERPRWLHENSVWWNHYSPQEIARAADSPPDCEHDLVREHGTSGSYCARCGAGPFEPDGGGEK